MRLSKQLNQEHFKIVKDYKNLDTYDLVEHIGFVSFPYSGFPLFLPLGQKMMQKIAKIIREEAEDHSFSEVYLPLVQHKRLIEQSGRSDTFNKEFMELSNKRNNYILSPTNEEVFLNLIKPGLETYRQLPIRLFQIADKFRDIAKPKRLIRSRQFLMADMCSIDADRASLEDSVANFELMIQSIFSRLDIETYRLTKNAGSYIDYVIPCNEGETKIATKANNTARYATASDPPEIIRRASSVGMYFIFKDASPFNVEFVGRNGKKHPTKMGTYGVGLQRCLHAVIEQHKDHLGINFPEELRPFDLSIIPFKPENKDEISEAIKLYNISREEGLKPLLDDRSLNLKTRAEYADFIGVPQKVIIGPMEIKTKTLTIKLRGKAEEKKINIEQFIHQEVNK